jgi:hypothetical protein
VQRCDTGCRAVQHYCEKEEENKAAARARMR